MPDHDKFIWDTIDLDEEILNEQPNININDNQDDQQDHCDEKHFEKAFKKHRKKRFLNHILKIGIIIIILLILSIFIPILPINKINYQQTNFINPQLISDTNQIKEGQFTSLFNIIKDQSILKKTLNCGVKVNYDLKQKSLDFNFEEKIPLAKYNNQTYYRYYNKIEKTSDFPYNAPQLIGFNDDQALKIIDQLGYLDYNILKEIVCINLKASNEEPNLVVCSMNDGNYVFINIEQIKDKMPYYNKMVNAIEVLKGPDSKGILHLDYGDYYEQI